VTIIATGFSQDYEETLFKSDNRRRGGAVRARPAAAAAAPAQAASVAEASSSDFEDAVYAAQEKPMKLWGRGIF
jgi:hypothetical protein